LPSLPHKFRLLHAFLLIILFNLKAYTQEKIVPNFPDSLSASQNDSTLVFSQDSTKILNNNALTNDSLARQKPLRPKTKKGSFESKVDYKATDSLRFNVKKQLVYLYGDAEVNYGKVNLKADYIELDLQKNEVFARGTPDSTGKEYGTPLFKDGTQEFEARDIRYNFSSEKGLITDAVTQQGDGFVKGKTVKRMPNEVIYIEDGQFCPCKDRDAKTYILAKKIKIIPNDKVVTGPANMKIGSIPTPLVLPFGIFPNAEGASSGLIIPKYGFSPGQGYFLQQGGYYWSINEYLDVSFTGDIYSRGSFGLGFASNYKKRYRSNGNLELRYTELKTGSEETLDLSKDQVYKVFWRHVQDNKAHPNSRFSADVNIYKNNRLDINSSSQEFLTNTFKSNINYNYNFPNSPFRLTLNGSHSLVSRTVNGAQVPRADMILPQATLNMDRIYPFKRKYKVGKDKLYDKIGLTYSTNFMNKISAHPDSLFGPKAISEMQNGIKHDFRLNTNAKVFKVASLEPFVTYSEFWEFKQLNQEFSTAANTLVKDTIGEFGRFGKISGGANLTTKIYGMYLYKRGPVKALRHVITPSIGLNLTPNYEGSSYIRNYQRDSMGTTGIYTLYDNGVYGRPNTGKETGIMSFNLMNNFEMKVLNKKDTTEEDATKKIKLVDQLNLGSTYDLFADSLNWNNISIRTSTTLFNFFRVQYTSALDPYSLRKDSNDVAYRVNKFELSENGRFGRFVTHSLGVNFSLSNKKRIAKKKKAIEEMKKSMNTYSVLPWSLSVGYNYNYARPNFDVSKNITQAITLNGNIQITDNWKFEGQLNYDIKAEDIAYTRFSIFRDLNCWEARISVVPKGGQQNYNFAINLKPAMFKDLKIERRRNYYDF